MRLIFTALVQTKHEPAANDYEPTGNNVMTDSLMHFAPLIGLACAALLLPVILEEIHRRNRKAQLIVLNVRHCINPQAYMKQMENRPCGARARARLVRNEQLMMQARTTK